MKITFTKKDIEGVIISRIMKENPTIIINDTNWKDYNDPNGFEVEIEIK